MYENLENICKYNSFNYWFREWDNGLIWITAIAHYWLYDKPMYE